NASLRRLAALALLYSLTLCLFFINERFRLPVIVILLPLAGVGAVTVWEALRALARRRAPAAPGLYLAPLAALALALAPIGRPVENAAARALYLRANAALRDGRTLEARRLFRAALAADPQSPRAALNLGVTYFLTGAADSAEYYFRRELQRSPSQPDALTNLASLKLTAGDLNAADSLSRLAYEVRPYDLTTVRLLLRVCAARDEMARCAEVAAAEGRFSADPRYWTERGLGYLQNGDTAAARESFERCVALEYRRQPGAAASDWAFEDIGATGADLAIAAAEANFRLGFLAGVSGDYRSAQRRSEAAIAIDSSRAAAYANLVLAYLSLGEVDSANAVYDLALSRFAGNERALDELRQAGGALDR
ncbi:MAG TPA: tetratricopeptide repeat protein, partial [candidate division Zixibacteria bacterium]|nr:tetratricopeptide repeat protein [candidate division Zixibacteria bacterium]